MQPEALAPLFDILQACERVMRFTEEHTEQDYETDELLRSAVERQLTIAGEALVRLRQRDRRLAESISEWDRIIAFRNRIIHGYDTISDATVWEIIERDVPRLAEEARALLEAADREARS